MAAVQLWWSSLVAAERSLLGMLDAMERSRVASLEPPADRGRSMLGAALLRVAAGAALDVPPGEVRVDRTCPECGRPHGAPRILASEAEAPWASVSHSGLLVVVALSRQWPVGVDVQRVADLPDPETAPEWVRREAVLKVRAVSAAPEQLASVRTLSPPMAGYAAALAATTPRPPAEAELDVRHWPDADRAG